MGKPMEETKQNEKNVPGLKRIAMCIYGKKSSYTAKQNKYNYTGSF